MNNDDAMVLSLPGVSAAKEAMRLKLPTTDTFLLVGKPRPVMGGAE